MPRIETHDFRRTSVKRCSHRSNDRRRLAQSLDKAKFAVTCDTFTDNAVPVFPGRAQENQTPFFLNDHSIEVPARGQLCEFAVRNCGCQRIAWPFYEPGSPACIFHEAFTSQGDCG
jgi:hypothetical protein